MTASCRRAVRGFDRRVWAKVAVLSLLAWSLFIRVAVGQTLPQQSAPMGPPLAFTTPPSLVEKWLDPTTFLTAFAFVLYLGELRGEMKRLKERAKAFDELEKNLDRRIEESYDRIMKRQQRGYGE